MATIVTINSTDLITNSRANLNTNFSNLNSAKIETSVIDTDPSLTADSDSNIPSQKAVKTYVDAGGNVNASTTQRGIVQEATAVQVAAATATGGTGAPLFVNPAQLIASGLFKFGGTGSDGALNVTSGTTTINLANAAVVVKNYTSINVSVGATLAFSNPNTAGTVIILKSQGAVTIAGTVNASGMGAAGGAAKSVSGSGGSQVAGNAGSNGNSFCGFLTAPGGGQGSGTGSPAPGTLSSFAINLLSTYPGEILKYQYLVTGAGGASGNCGNTNSDTEVSGIGGNGGPVLLFECSGAWNFTGTISVAGQNGSNSTSGAHVGGGGGGAAGQLWVYYNTLTANSGTVTTTGGSAGTGAGTTSAGGGGANFNTSGSSSTGAAGFSYVAQNTVFT